jgi:PAS domain S-box-containing protein
MDRTHSLPSDQTLHTYSDTIAEQWHQKIEVEKYVTTKGSNAFDQLVESNMKAVKLLFTEPFEPDLGEEIGAQLACVHYVNPEAFGRTLQVLADQLVGGSDTDKGSTLQPRLAQIITSLATGFFHQARRTLIQEQQAPKDQLFENQEEKKNELLIMAGALASSIHGVAITDMDDLIRYANCSFLDMWGYDSAEEVLGRHAVEFWGKKEAAVAALDSVKKGSTWTGVLAAEKRDGSLFDVHLSAHLVGNDHERVICMMGSFVDSIEKRKMEKTLRELETTLATRTKRLEEVNTTVKVLLEKISKDKDSLVERVQLNVKELVFPLLQKIRKATFDPRQLSNLDMIESNLSHITTSFSQLLSSRYQGLTPMEIRIANIIREGKNTREVAELMNLSPRTIESHRRSLRNKMGISDRKESLRCHLLSLSRI